MKNSEFLSFQLIILINNYLRSEIKCKSRLLFSSKQASQITQMCSPFALWASKQRSWNLSKKSALKAISLFICVVTYSISRYTCLPFVPKFKKRWGKGDAPIWLISVMSISDDHHELLSFQGKIVVKLFGDFSSKVLSWCKYVSRSKSINEILNYFFMAICCRMYCMLN